MLYPPGSRVRHPIRGTGTVIAVGRTDDQVNNDRKVQWDTHPIHNGKQQSRWPRTTTVPINNLSPEFPINNRQKETTS